MGGMSVGPGAPAPGPGEPSRKRKKGDRQKPADVKAGAVAAESLKPAKDAPPPIQAKKEPSSGAEMPLGKGRKRAGKRRQAEPKITAAVSRVLPDQSKPAGGASRRLSEASFEPGPAAEPLAGEIITVHGPHQIKGVKVPVREDGDCLFHAFEQGLRDIKGYLKKYELSSEPLTVGKLREEISAGIKEKLEKEPDYSDFFMVVLLDANQKVDDKIDDYTKNLNFSRREGLVDEIPRIEDAIQEQEALRINSPEEYADKVRTPGFWGGDAEIGVFSNRYCVNVKIFQYDDEGQVREGHQPLIEPNPERLREVDISQDEVPTIYLIATQNHYDYFRRMP